jgi:acyl-CoA thioester hydrolase
MNAMKTTTLVSESKSIIRFADCDPFQHLNNARYIDYFLNAREDHLMQDHRFNLYELAREKGLAWHTTRNQIAYLRPASVMETVAIQSCIIQWNKRSLRVEMRMCNNTMTSLKALIWSDFTHVNLKEQRSIDHNEELNAFFKPLVNILPAEHVSFEERLAFLKNKTAAELDHPFSHFYNPLETKMAIAV